MPMYTVHCEGTCTSPQDIRLSFGQYDQAKTGELALLCPHCGESAATLVFSPGNLGFTLADGESGGWASKAIKENKYRASRNAIMAKRERDHVMKNQLVPNYGGVEGHSWSDIRDHVRSVKGVESASTYDPLVSKEKAKAP